MKTGLLFRSMSPEFMTEKDVDYVRNVLGIRFVADLRGSPERDSGALGQPPAERRIFHFIDMKDHPALRDLPPEQAMPVYLERSGDAIAEAVSFLADAHPGAAVFHCLTGKDRTGALAAILLGLFGVSEEDIVEDHMLGAPIANEVIEIMAAAGRPLPEDAPVHAKSPPSEPAIRAFLRKLNDDYGGPRIYLEGLGLSTQLDRLIERMVE